MAIRFCNMARSAFRALARLVAFGAGFAAFFFAAAFGLALAEANLYPQSHVAFLAWTLVLHLGHCFLGAFLFSFFLATSFSFMLKNAGLIVDTLPRLAMLCNQFASNVVCRTGGTRSWVG